jgi:hypothetical protein
MTEEPSSSRKRSRQPKKAVDFSAFDSMGQLTEDADLVLQPWFLPEKVSRAIRSLIPLFHAKKLRYYFDDFGCIRCERKDVLYGSNGFCDACLRKVVRGIAKSLRQRVDELEAEMPVNGRIFSDGMMRAERLIRRSTENSRNHPGTGAKNPPG